MNNQFSNLSLLFIFVCLLIIIINVLGGSMIFKDTVRFSFNNMIYPNQANEDAFIDAEAFVAELSNITNTIKEAKNGNKPTNKETVQENFSIQTRTFSSNDNSNNELMNEMTNFKPFNSNDGKNNIQSNLIDVCNQTQESIHQILTQSEP